MIKRGKTVEYVSLKDHPEIIRQRLGKKAYDGKIIRNYRDARRYLRRHKRWFSLRNKKVRGHPDIPLIIFCDGEFKSEVLRWNYETEFHEYDGYKYNFLYILFFMIAWGVPIGYIIYLLIGD